MQTIKVSSITNGMDQWPPRKGWNATFSNVPIFADDIKATMAWCAEYGLSLRKISVKKGVLVFGHEIDALAYLMNNRG